MCVYLQEGEFKKSVNIEGLAILPLGVLVVWDWEWNSIEQCSGDEEESDSDERSHYNPHMNSDESDTDEEQLPTTPTDTHVVRFKCMGTLYEQSRQTALEKAAKLMHQGTSVPVKLVPEPDNKYDSKAIAFHCELDGKWYSIGYIVREALDAVHKAIKKTTIHFVKFAWVKYRVVWMRSGPGFYAGIDIALNGKWPQIVVQHASTH